MDNIKYQEIENSSNEDDLKVFVIIPTYGRDDLLKICLESIQNNSYKNIEVIVVDDYSPQPFQEMVENFGFWYLRHEKNKGAGAARNTGASLSRGNILLFVDSDIELYPDTIQKIVDEFRRNSKIFAVTALISAENRYKNFISKYKTAFMRWSAVDMKPEVAYICTSCAAIKKDIFDETGGFPEYYKGASWEDTEIGLKIIEKNGAIRFNKNIEVRHNKRLIFRQLLRSDYKRTVEFISLLFGKRKQLLELNKRGLKISNADKGAIIALIASYFVVILSVIAIFLLSNNINSPYFYYLYYLLIIMILVFIVGSSRFLKVCYEVGGFWFTIKAFFLYFFLNLIYGVAIADGIIRYVYRKKT